MRRNRIPRRRRRPDKDIRLRSGCQGGGDKASPSSRDGRDAGLNDGDA